MEQSQFLLDKQTLTVKPVTCSFEISIDGNFKQKVTGIYVIPYHFRIEPLKIKDNLIRKSDDKRNTLKELHEGKYYVNIIDYSFGEVLFIADFLCERWADNLLKFLLSEKDDYLTVSLEDDALKNQILSLNPLLFDNLESVNTFLEKYKLSISDFCKEAKFNQLQLELEGVSARLSSEIIFYRKKIFLELLIQKIDQKIYEYEEIRKLLIKQENKEIYLKWKTEQCVQIELVQRYINSPFTFGNIQQYSSYSSLNNFSIDINQKNDLISETLYWINIYPKVKKRFEIALEHYNSNNNYRDCLDNLRLCLEILLKILLNNEKSLENQLKEISIYQENLGIGTEIRNTFRLVLDYYNKYNNNNVKHDDRVESIHEVEFIFGLTMIFIRMLIKPADQLRINNEIN